MLRIWTSRNKNADRRDSSPSATRASAPWAVAAFCALASALAGCAGSGKPQASTPRATPAVPATAPSLRPATPDMTFMASNAASESSEFIRLGRESMRDSAWFEAAEYLDSAMTHLAVLETQSSLTAGQRLAVQTYQDSVRDWLVESVSQSSRLGGGEADDLSEYLDHEIEEVSFASLEDLEALLPRLPNRNYSIPLPSPLPHSVLQAMKVFTGSGRGYFEKWLQRKGRYEPLITGKLDERGMPRDLVYLAMVESGFNPKAWSHASASGLWQFISPTGKRYGLNDDWWEDGRRDPVRATDAALDYLEDLYSEFDDWHQAMAAYNCGEGRIRRQLRADPKLSYWDMSLPAETRFYVPKILAAMIIGNNPASFGFRVEDNSHAPLAFDTVTVTRCLPLSGIASAVGVHEDSLRSLNPSLRRWCTPPGRTRYTVYLPEGTREIFLGNYQGIQSEVRVSQQTHVVGRGQTLSGIAVRYGVTIAALQRANGLRGTKLRRGQSLIIPGGSSESVAAAPAPSAAAPSASTEAASEPAAKTVRTASLRHVVRRGETLSGLAARYGVTASAVKAASGLSGNRLRIGQRLTIPAESAAELRVETVSTTAENVTAAPTRRHTVRRGETLGGIARQFRVSVSALRRLNGMTPRTVLRAGQVLSIPSGARPASESEEASVRDPNLGRKVYVVRQGDNLSELAGRFGVSQADLQRWNALRGTSLQVGQRLVYHGGNEAVRLASASNEYYRVKSGDNLWDISSRFGQSVEDVKRLNGGLTEELHPGQRIRIR